MTRHGLLTLRLVARPSLHGVSREVGMNRITRMGLVLVTVIALLMAGRLLPTSISAGRIVRGASMHDRRADHSSTLLPDGRVLIAGGMVENGIFLNSAELYDPGKGGFVSTASMQSRRVGHSATLLPNGKVLLAGGLAGRIFEGGPGIVATTETYDPAISQFVAGPLMGAPRSGHAAVLLRNKKVLIVGGEDNNERPLATTEFYDPASNRFGAAAGMQVPRVAHSAVMLQDGRVLVTGGVNGRASALASAEIYDPSTGAWHAAGDMTSPREKHAATLLPDGRVLITGGSADGEWHPVRTAELFDPRTNKFTAIDDMELARFKLPGATARLQNGKVLVAGGASEAEIYDGATGKFSRAGCVGEPHYFATATLLKNGQVLITGGYGRSHGRSNGPVSSEQAWIYQP